MDDTFDPVERAKQKTAQREEQARAIASGEKTREQVRREVSHFAAIAHAPIDFTRMRRP